MARRLQRDLPFARIAVVLPGGGALGAYEVGALRAIRAAGLVPAVVAGASAGALNAVAWVADGFDPEPLAGVWRRLEPASIGMRWSALAWRAAGAFLVALGAVEVALTLMGSPELSLATWLRGQGVARAGVVSVLLDVAAWAFVSALGALMLRGAVRAEVLLSRAGASSRRRGTHPAIAVFLAGWAVVHLTALASGVPWPHRFSATLLAAATLVWLSAKPGRVGDWLRRIFSRLLPESRGRGFWGDSARRGILRQLVAEGSAERLVSGAPVVMLTGLSLQTGRVAIFVAGEEIGEAFRSRAHAALGEVVPLTTPQDVLDAAIASSSIPIFFEPTAVRGREYVDAVALSTHPLRAALLAGVDAALVVVTTPTEAALSSPGRSPHNLVELWGRYLDIATWRDLQQELRALPSEWRSPASPRPLCVVEPEGPLPGGVLAYAPALAEELLRRGEADAWRALERAGWLEGGGR